jgi:hypothetical protein
MATRVFFWLPIDEPHFPPGRDALQPLITLVK